MATIRARLNTLHDRLSRTTSSGEFIPEVDGLRFLAIAAVLLHHLMASYLRTTQRLGPVDLPAQWGEVVSRSSTVTVGYAGHFGVPLFFVISGFVLSLPFARSYLLGGPRPHLGAYYLRRLVRLEVPYVVNIAVAFLAIVAVNPGWRGFKVHLPPTLLYLHGPVFGQASWVNGIAWSLEVEVQFYLVMPLLALVWLVRCQVARRLLLLAAMPGLAFLASRFIDPHAQPRLALSLLNHLHFFVAGFLLADLYQAYAADAPRRRVGWDIAWLAAGIAIYVILTRRYDLFFLTPLLIVVLYMGLFLGRFGHFCIRQRWVVVIGGMCYTIYLYHFLLIDLLAPSTMRLAAPGRRLSIDFALQCALLVPAILLVSGVLFLAIEKPFMDLSRTLSRRLRSRRGRGLRRPYPNPTMTRSKVRG